VASRLRSDPRAFRSPSTVGFQEHLKKLAGTWQKPIMFNEFGYTTRKNSAIRPWEWLDKMSHVQADQGAQADAYRPTAHSCRL